MENREITSDYRGLKNYHPAAAFLCVFCPAALTMLLFHPLALAASFCGAFTACMFCCRKSAVSLLKITLPFSAVIIVFNSLVNHRGNTVLFRLLGNKVTLESVLYGFFSALLILSVSLWFCLLNAVISQQKAMFLFAGIAPSATMLVTMTSRAIPLLKQRSEQINNAARYLYARENGMKEKMSRSVKKLSTLLLWSMEESVDTADSMKARGYDIDRRQRRTSYLSYAVTAGDLLVIAVTLVLSAFTVAGILYPAFACDVFSKNMIISSVEPENSVYWAALFFTMAFPFFIEVFDRIRYNI